MHQLFGADPRTVCNRRELRYNLLAHLQGPITHAFIEGNHRGCQRARQVPCIRPGQLQCHGKYLPERLNDIIIRDGNNDVATAGTCCYLQTAARRIICAVCIVGMWVCICAQRVANREWRCGYRADMHGNNRICTLVDRQSSRHQCYFQNRGQHLVMDQSPLRRCRQAGSIARTISQAPPMQA